MSDTLKAPKYGFAAISGVKLRHVVFVDRSKIRKRALNMMPAPQRSMVEAPSDLVPSEMRGQAEFVKWLFERCGVDVKNYGWQTLSRRLPSCLRVLRAESTPKARQILEEKPDLLPLALSNVVLGVTSFFRDASVFDFLREQVLPELAQSRGRLRIWSIGASDGAELYSVAILAAELGLLGRCEMMGSDCRSDAIARARGGLFDDSALKFAPPPLVCKYFTREGHLSRVAEGLRKSIDWRVSDVLQQIEPGQWNLILCRNMAMYLTPQAAGRLWKGLEPSVRVGGYIALGKAERPVGASQFSLTGPCIYRKDRGRSC